MNDLLPPDLAWFLLGAMTMAILLFAVIAIQGALKERSLARVRALDLGAAPAPAARSPLARVPALTGESHAMVAHRR